MLGVATAKDLFLYFVYVAKNFKKIVKTITYEGMLIITVLE